MFSSIAIPHPSFAIQPAQTKETESGIAKDHREAAVQDFFRLCVLIDGHPAAISGFAEYKVLYADRAAHEWFSYLEQHWLADQWWPFLIISERNRFSRLQMNTTNSVELLWKLLKRNWLGGVRVRDYVLAIITLVGRPFSAEATAICLVSRAVRQLEDVLLDIEKPPGRIHRKSTVSQLLLRTEAIDSGAISIDTVCFELGVLRFTWRAGIWKFISPTS
jgi:hypothetical protein